VGYVGRVAGGNVQIEQDGTIIQTKGRCAIRGEISQFQKHAGGGLWGGGVSGDFTRRKRKRLASAGERDRQDGSGSTREWTEWKGNRFTNKPAGGGVV